MNLIRHSAKAVVQLLYAVSALSLSTNAFAVSPLPLTQYVNPFAGTSVGTDKFGFSGDSGDVFPGALWPRGMVQFSPDTPANLPGGYDYRDSAIKDFSLTHFSGRGCTAYQDVPFMPIVGKIGASPGIEHYPYSSSFSHANEIAHPGYYQVDLDSGITVELTATAHTGLAAYHFPAASDGTVLINCCGSVNGNGAPTELSITSDHEVSGEVTSHVGCGGEHYTLYFVTEFSKPFSETGTWSGDTVTSGSRSVTGGVSGAYVTFQAATDNTVLSKTGISYVSLENARANLSAEESAWDFTAIRDGADRAWNKVLNRVQIKGGSAADLATFYTALYHAFIHPNILSDDNGQYIGFDNAVHTLATGHVHYENIPGWDCYRSCMPLQALLAPGETSDVAQSLVDDALQGGGGLPRWEQTNHNSAGMCGDSDLIILATAYAYDANNFNTRAALKAMIADASDPNTRSDGHRVRENMDQYLEDGYIHGAGYFSASATLEYCSDDFALSQFAAQVGDESDAAHFVSQAQNWKNLFNQTAGYIVPRNSDGRWIPNFDPASDTGFVEGSGAQYFWEVPFNLASLFKGIGGNQPAAARLDKFFSKINDGLDQYAFMGNEPSFEVPWEYDWAGDPAGTQSVVRRIQNQLFNASPNGLPGNDDGGATSSWYVWSAIGLYPEIPGVGGYAVGSPRFPLITIYGDGRAPIVIRAPKAEVDNPYVVDLSVNGKPYNCSWIPWSSLSKGAALSFDLGPVATHWGADANDAPPSFDASPLVISSAPG